MESQQNVNDLAVLKKTKEVFKEGQRPEDVMALYDGWSANYEEMLLEGQYNAHYIAVDEVLRQVPEDQRSRVRVLDVAAGTGLVGKELSQKGFKHLDALEPSAGMMKKLIDSGIYNVKYQEFVGLGQNTVPKETYDIVVISGAMGNGHIPVSGIDDLVRVTKPGGLVIISMRLAFLESAEDYKDKLEPYMDQLEKNGVWKQVTRKVVPNYFYDSEGVVITYRVA